MQHPLGYDIIREVANKMILFQREYNDLILNGKKRFTIRKGNRKNRFKIGSIHLCKNKLFSKNYFAKVKIKSIEVKPFKDLNIKDAKDDLFNSVLEMKETLYKLNKNLNSMTLMTKIGFELVRQ